MVKRAVIAGFLGIVTTGCASGQDKEGWPGQRSPFRSPYGHSPVLLTNPTTQHPPYVICNADRCFYLDDDGNFTRMSKEERRSLSLGVRLSEENRRFNERRQRLPDSRSADLRSPDPSDGDRDATPLRQQPNHR
jgi:hypothetical protein